jgi:DNA-binding transcriptional MerR regulator
VSGQGRYRIHAVADLTGIPEATLRAWERRYSVPTPERTPSGYRLYSPKDVELVKRMRELCSAGMAPVDAAKLVGEPERTPTPDATDRGPFDAVATRIASAARRLDPSALEAEVRLAMTLGDASSIVERGFCPALVEIGRDWEAGLISTGHEHMASEILVAATRNLLRLVGPVRPVGEVVLACFPDEEHVLPLYAAAFRFVECGYRPHVLGARTPPSGLSAAARELQPAFIGLSVTIAPPAARADELVHEYAKLLRPGSWCVGGAGAPELERTVRASGGHVVCGTADEQRDLLAPLLAHRPASPRRSLQR